MIMGHVTRDIELRYTPKGTAVADISLAINRKTEDKEETTFVDVTLWGRTAEVAHQYSGKGKPLFVEGRLQTDTWDDKETGKKRSKLKVVAENIQLLGSSQKGVNSGQGSAQNQQTKQPQQAQVEVVDDIPF